MKKSIALILTCVMCLCLLTACGGSKDTPAADADTPTNSAEKVGQTVFKCAFNQSIDNPQAQTILKLSDDLYDATSGRYSIEVYPNEQLGDQAASMELCQSGAIDMTLVANTIIENSSSDFAMLGTPYVYDSIDHMERFLESGLLDELYATTEPHGFKVLCSYSLGSRSVYTKNDPVTSPEDMHGLKIRVMQSDTMVQMINYMNGVGTPMAQGEVYSAIQAGTLDGAENNIITYMDLLQYEVAPYYSYTNHLMVPDQLCINLGVFNSMSAEDQAAFLKVANESIGYQFDLAAELRNSYQADAESHGVIFTEVDITPFQENMAPFIEEVANRTELTKSVYEAILSTR